MRWLWTGFVLAAAAWLVSAQSPGRKSAASAPVEERLARHRNLGKAFYENPATQQQAVEEFRRAFDLQPDSVREQLNYGLALLRAGKTAEGIEILEAVQKRDPKLPHPYFNLGVEYKKQGETDKALANFAEFAKLVPGEPMGRYNLGVMLKAAGRQKEAIAEFEEAAKLDPNLAAARFQLFNAYRQAGRQPEAQRMLAEFQRLKKEQEGSATPEDVDWCAYSEIYETIDPAKVAAAPPPVTLKFDDVVLGEGFAGVVQAGGMIVGWSKAGLKGFGGGVPAIPGVVDAAAGDFNNDGFVDLCVVTDTGVSVAVLGPKTGKLDVAAGKFHACVWLDYDHDYDLDLILLGKDSKLYRNQGQAGFADRTADFPFVAGEAIAGVVYRIVPDTRGMDLTVSYQDRSGVVYRDLLAGKYRAEDLRALPPGARGLIAADTDNDGRFELLWARGGKPALAADPDNSGIARTDWNDRILADAVAWAAGDFNRDGKEDYAAVTADGKLHRLTNRTASPNQWIGVQLTGVKNLLTAPYAEVEVKAGTLYQKKLYRGAPLVFGLRNLTSADTVRITWPNALIQNEPNQAAGRDYTYKEAQRLSGSCPIIWTWDGKGFRYITDVLGVAPLGAAAGDGKYFDTDHDEYVFIPGEALKERDGSLEVRITEELSEVAYLDQVQLIAVDHPAEVAIYHNDKWKGPPYPEFRLWGVRERIRPRLDSHPYDFRRQLNGIADMHALTMSFPESAPRRAALVLAGWVDWADGSTFLAAAQESPEGLVPPILEARDERGGWVVINPDMGMPAGKPKAIVVEVEFPSRYRDLRITTNLCVYWDDIFLSPDLDEPPATLTRLAAHDADLRFRGFSPNRVHPQRKEPERFFYEGAMPTTLWNPTPGLYTRYGQVAQLLDKVDDRFVVMGSGDEIRLLFDARRLPALPAGWSRDYLLLVDGWAKDRDANTAFSQNVLPLPFHAMSGYPFKKKGEQHPDMRYQREFNTRPGLRLIRPLTE
jgi:tetratricopeptide (TPR) repeat protein